MDAPNLYSAHDSKRDSPAILFRRLGFGFPLELVQPGAFQTYWDRSECLILQREKEMLTFMDRITDLENWRDKVFDEEALSIWRGEQVEGTGFWSRECFNQSINELRYKAGQFVDTETVMVYDVSSCIVKSDSIISDDIKKRLQRAVQVLEDVPNQVQKFSPNQEEIESYLIEPSLFPLIYGKSRVLKDRKLDIDTSLDAVCEGEVVTWPQEVSPGTRLQRYQWLPCEVQRSSEDGPVKITSYINNVHPRHAEFYRITEELIAKCIPLWSQMLHRTFRVEPQRRISINCNEYGYDGTQWSTVDDDQDKPSNEGEQHVFIPEAGTFPSWPDPADFHASESDSDDSDVHRRYTQGSSSHEDSVPGLFLTRPEPIEFHPTETPTTADGTGKTALSFASFPNLQVVVKFTNISLQPSPSKSAYSDDQFHLEGLLNDQIAACAFYYYDSDNITGPRVAFKQKFEDVLADNGWDTNCNAWNSLEDFFGINETGRRVQLLGSVEGREGRLVAFPNTLLHRTEPFQLIDDTKPGHCKVAAFFLVDPHVRILSTANVAPQRKDWWMERMVQTQALGMFPQELQDQILANVEDVPMDLEEGRKHMLELMQAQKEAHAQVEATIPPGLRFSRNERQRP